MNVQYPFRNNLLLYGASAKAEVVNYVRTECIPEEEASLPSILSDWSQARSHFQDLEQKETEIAETIDSKEIPSEFTAEIKAIERSVLFKETFSLLPYDFKLVEIDRLVAGQRAVNLDYVDLLMKRIPVNPSLSDLIRICLASPTDPKPPAEQMLSQNMLSFTSENLDFRFLGGYKKKLTQEDVEACVSGGFPMSAIVLLVGMGASAMNVIESGRRVVLNNGFHRAYALRGLGVTHIPVVFQKVTNPQLEFPPTVANLPKEYLLGVQRPALMKDFFDSLLVRKLKVKARNKVVQVQWGASQFALPIVG